MLYTVTIGSAVCIFPVVYSSLLKRVLTFTASAAILAAFVVAHPVAALAQADSTSTMADVGTTAGLASTDLLVIIGTIISVVLGFLGVIFLILIIYSGFLWMTAAGNEDRVKKAQKILINATVGIIIVLTAYGIATFILNALGAGSSGGGSSTDNGVVSVEALSGSLGAGILRDHYPERNATDIARNTHIMVTFAEPMDIASFILDYDTSGTGTDVSDDVATGTLIDSTLVAISSINPDTGLEEIITDVDVYFTDDLKTFTFAPQGYLGSATADTLYSVELKTDIKTAALQDAFTGVYSSGYVWSFTVGTTIDLTPPHVVSVVPAQSQTFDRNISVEATFSEAMDPTSSTGTRTATSGFQNIQTISGTSGTAQAGTYEISNGYKTVTYTSTDACGTNSCGETIYCLPANDDITLRIAAATTTASPPQADSFPYDGVTDAAANSLDGNNDGTAGDDFPDWSFSTSGDINMDGPVISTISPNILGEDQALDQPVVITFLDIMRTLTLTSSNISMSNKETATGGSHEMWFLPRSVSIDELGAEVIDPAEQVAVHTQTTIGHGTFLASVDGRTYLYAALVEQGIQNQYQNCYSPANGPDASGVDCAVTPTSPSCCNGNAQSATCDLLPVTP
jgi:hypothetical protein